MKKFWKRAVPAVVPLGEGRYRLEGVASASAVADTERFVQQMEALRTPPGDVQRMSAAPDSGLEPFVITVTGGRWKIDDGGWNDIPPGMKAVVRVESGHFDAPIGGLPWMLPVVPADAHKGSVEIRPEDPEDWSKNWPDICYHRDQTAEWQGDSHTRRCPDCPAISMALNRTADPLGPWYRQ